MGRGGGKLLRVCLMIFFSRVIGDSLLKSTLPFNYKYSTEEFRMMATAYVANMNRENEGYIYDQLYRQVWPPHDAEKILIQRGRHWCRS